MNHLHGLCSSLDDPQLHGVFITGTDTGCGKTRFSLGLMAFWQRRFARVLGMKPVATGGHQVAGGWRNADAESLWRLAGQSIPYEWINPCCFPEPIAPHIAAAHAGQTIDEFMLKAACLRLAERADRLVVEGVGGWRVPLGPHCDVASLAGQLGFPVILVVGMRLGVLNHAILTADAIARSTKLLGWVANQVDPRQRAQDENLEALRERIAAPCLAMIPWQPEAGPEEVATVLEYQNTQAGRIV